MLLNSGDEWLINLNDQIGGGRNIGYPNVTQTHTWNIPEIM